MNACSSDGVVEDFGLLQPSPKALGIRTVGYPFTNPVEAVLNRVRHQLDLVDAMVRGAFPIPVPKLPPLPLHPLDVGESARVKLQRHNLRVEAFGAMP